MSNNNVKNEHILWIDIAKGIGCILVLLGHFWYNAPHPKINILIYSFHIALFFICAGYIFKVKKDSKFFDNIMSKIKRLIIPTTFFIIFGIIMKFILGEVTSYKELFKQAIYWDGKLPFNDPAWFFIVLFEVYVIIYTFQLILKNKLNSIFIITLTIVFFILGYLVYKYKVFIPFGINRALFCFGWFTSGILIRRICDYFSNNNCKLLLLNIILVISTVLWFLIALANGKVTIYGNILHEYWLLMISGILGTISFLIVCYYISFIKQTSIFTKISSISIFLIGTHYIPRYYIETAVKQIWHTNIYIAYIFIMTTLLILIYIPLCKVLDKYVPFLTGKIKK